MKCKQCESEGTELRRRKLRNGSIQIVHQCLTCGRNASNPIKHSDVRDMWSLPEFDHGICDRWTEQRHREALEKRAQSKEFYESEAWFQLRYEAIAIYGRQCMACGATDGPIHVDHIKPRSKYPELALELSNLQILCRDCNIGKGAWDETDWRD